jgi:hypothetical protein
VSCWLCVRSDILRRGRSTEFRTPPSPTVDENNPLDNNYKQRQSFRLSGRLGHRARRPTCLQPFASPIEIVAFTSRMEYWRWDRFHVTKREMPEFCHRLDAVHLNISVLDRRSCSSPHSLSTALQHSSLPSSHISLEIRRPIYYRDMLPLLIPSSRMHLREIHESSR